MARVPYRTELAIFSTQKQTAPIDGETWLLGVSAEWSVSAVEPNPWERRREYQYFFIHPSPRASESDRRGKCDLRR
jgi:hypothetical protein